MSVGVHHYKVDCEYECVFPIKHSHCKSQTLDIFVEIVGELSESSLPACLWIQMVIYHESRF